jgi:hypothetical protein
MDHQLIGIHVGAYKKRRPPHLLNPPYNVMVPNNIISEVCSEFSTFSVLLSYVNAFFHKNFQLFFFEKIVTRR